MFILKVGFDNTENLIKGIYFWWELFPRSYLSLLLYCDVLWNAIFFLIIDIFMGLLMF